MNPAGTVTRCVDAPCVQQGIRVFNACIKASRAGGFLPVFPGLEPGRGGTGRWTNTGQGVPAPSKQEPPQHGRRCHNGCLNFPCSEQTLPSCCLTAAAVKTYPLTPPRRQREREREREREILSPGTLWGSCSLSVLARRQDSPWWSFLLML